MSGNFVTIVTGSVLDFYVDLNNPDSREPYDLTGATAITVSMPAADGTAVTVDMTSGVTVLGHEGAGRISVQLSPAKSALLLVNPSQVTFQDLQVEVVDSNGQPNLFILPQSLNIIAPDFPIV